MTPDTITIPAFPSAFDGKIALQFFAAAVDCCLEAQKPGTPGATPWELLHVFERHVTPEVAAELILTGRKIEPEPRKSMWQRIRQWWAERRLRRALVETGRA